MARIDGDAIVWLLLQLDEDERIGRALPGPSPEQRAAAGGRDYLTPVDPARTLLWVRSVRRIIEDYRIVDAAVQREAGRNLNAPDLDTLYAQRDVLAGVVRLLAEPYADRPGYPEEFRQAPVEAT